MLRELTSPPVSQKQPSHILVPVSKCAELALEICIISMWSERADIWYPKYLTERNLLRREIYSSARKMYEQKENSILELQRYHAEGTWTKLRTHPCTGCMTLLRNYLWKSAIESYQRDGSHPTRGCTCCRDTNKACLGEQYELYEYDDGIK